MKILMVDKYFFIKGGAERYYFELKVLLEKHGHEVIPFSMRHMENFPSAWERYFVDNIEFNDLSDLRKIRMAPKIIGRVLYSTTAKQALEKLITAVKPDLAHLHMIDHQISPSILHVLQKHDIPVLQTCHQYKLICPSYRLLVMRENRLCEKCVTGHFYHAIAERCHKDSVAASANPVTAELSITLPDGTYYLAVYCYTDEGTIVQGLLSDTKILIVPITVTTKRAVKSTRIIIIPRPQ